MTKALFLCKKSHNSIDQAIVLISSRVRDTNGVDWDKLFQVMSFLKGTIKGVLSLEAGDTNTLTWYIYVALYVHNYMKIHTRAVPTMVKEAMIKI